MEFADKIGKEIRDKLLQSAGEHEQLAKNISDPKNPTDITSHLLSLKFHNLGMQVLLRLLAGKGPIEQILDELGVEKK